MDLNNSTIIITGASDGIGKQIALELARGKARLLLLGRDLIKLKEVKKDALAAGSPQVEVYSVDLRDPISIGNFANKLYLDFQEVHGIINDAGIWQKKASLEDISEEEILSVLNTNLTGMILLTKRVIPILKEANEAFIINVSSRSGYSAQAGQSIYSASKYGVKGFTEVLREDLKDSNIRVSGVYQGGTNTQMFNKAGEDFSEEKLATFIPAEELAKIISFLISRPKSIWLPEIKIENK